MGSSSIEELLSYFSGVCVGICATSEAILIVLVLYLLVPPMGDYTVVFIHCKPWGEKKAKERNTNKIIKYIFIALPREVGPSDFPSGKSLGPTYFREIQI